MAEKCPSELWTRIFVDACTDGGLTGCSLSLVSHYFREAVLPVQLHSVFLASTKKMTLFIDLLERRPQAHGRVRHLFLSRFRERHDVRISNVAGNRNDFAILRRVLDAVAPDLVTLASTLPQIVLSLDQILATTFPVLSELTVHGYVIYPDTNGEAGLHGYLPALRYLHILSSPESCPAILRRAPALTHLRLSSVASMDAALYEQLINFLKGNSERTAEHPPLFPSTLQRIVIEPYAQSLFRLLKNGHPSIFTPSTSKALLEADRDKKMVFLRSKNHRDHSQPDVRKQYWGDRILGGPGCWVDPEPQDTLGELLASLGSCIREL